MAAERLKDLLTFLGTLTGIKGCERNDSQQKLLQSCICDFKGGPPIELSQGTAMLEQVKFATIPGWMKDCVVQAVEEKMVRSVATPTAGQGQRKQMQRNMHLHNYFNQEEWDMLQNPRLSLDTKLETLGKRFGALGLTCASEPTYVLANAILHIAVHTGPPETIRVDMRKALNILKDLKLVVKTKTKRVTHSGILIYPANPSELAADFLKEAYAELPVKCPLDVAMITNLAEEFPARKTKGTITGQNRSTGFQRDEGLKEWLGTMVMNNFLNMNGNMASGSEASVLPLTMGVNRGVKRTHSQLALEDGTTENGKQNLDNEEKQNEEKKSEGKGVHDAKDKVPQNPAKTIEQMAEDIQHQLEANKGKHDKTEKPKAAAKAKTQVKKKDCGDLTFIGTSEQPAKHVGNATIYTCPKSSSWRVKKTGDKKDKAFSWKKEAPKDVWKKVMAYVKEINK